MGGNELVNTSNDVLAWGLLNSILDGSTSDPHRQAQSYIQCSLPNLLRFQARYSESHKAHSASGRRFSQPAGRFSPAGHNPSAGWGYALQCSPSVHAGGKVFGGLPILPDKTAEYKATYCRRRLTENGLSSTHLESRFYAVLSKAAQVA
jgi:hypothetical protein